MANTGKKYIKLRGDEVATDEAQARANKFMIWYGRNADYIKERLIFAHLYDDEVATDTMLYLYECIALRGTRISKYKWYYLRAYHNKYLEAQKKRGRVTARTVYLDDAEQFVNDIPASDFNYDDYEEQVEALRLDILEYVRGSFDAFSVSLFEIYIELQPEMSYAALARALGLADFQVAPVLRAIKKDLVYRFAEKRGYLLSLL